jgi:hypothetical protein
VQLRTEWCKNDVVTTMETAARELLRAIRGVRSQVAFSRRLGYRGNVAAAWEAGRRFPTAAETLRACKRSRIDVEAAFLRFHAPTAAMLGPKHDVPRWLDALRGSTKIAVIAARAGASRFAVSRWLKGSTEPRLPDFLRLVDAISGRASDLVAALVGIEAIPTLAAEHRRREAARRLAFEEPWTEAVLRVIETDAYRALDAHEPGFVAARLGIDRTIEARALDRMRSAGVVTDEAGKLVAKSPLSVDTRTFPDALVTLRTHWSDVARDRIALLRPEDVFAYNVMSCSHADLERIRGKLRDVYREIRSIVAASPPETVALLNLQLVALDEAARPG